MLLPLLKVQVQCCQLSKNQNSHFHFDFKVGMYVHMYCKYVASFDFTQVTVGNTDMQSVELRRVLLLLCFVNEGPQMVVPASI